MKKIEIRDDIIINYFEIQDGEALCLQEETPEGITCEIILIRPVALKLAKVINNLMKSNEKTKN